MVSEKKLEPKEQKIVLNRNSENGQFVTEAYRKRNPATTEREVRRITSSRSTRSRGR